MGQGVSGLLGSVVVILGGTPVIEGIGEWNLDISVAQNEVSEFGDTWKYEVSGLRSATVSFMGNGRTDGTAQDLIRAMVLAGSAFGVRLYEDASKYWSGSVSPTGLGRAQSVQGKLETTYNGNSLGPFTYT